jgi:hypothetical protein
MKLPVINSDGIKIGKIVVGKDWHCKIYEIKRYAY